jgi:hypothetical protein
VDRLLTSKHSGTEYDRQRSDDYFYEAHTGPSLSSQNILLAPRASLFSQQVQYEKHYFKKACIATLDTAVHVRNFAIQGFP